MATKTKQKEEKVPNPAAGYEQSSDPSTGKLSTTTIPDTYATGAGFGSVLSNDGKFKASKPPGIQTDINTILEPYLKELQNLGPEYQAEMDYLKPYLEGGGQETFSQLEAGSKADESPTGSKAVNEADQAAGTALENQQPPGFGNLAKATQEFEGTVPYSQLLQTVLGAGKNEILYGTIPNISNIGTQNWPQSLQDAYSFLTQAATGTNAKSGLNAPTVAAQTAPNPNQPQAGPNAQGGGNVG